MTDTPLNQIIPFSYESKDRLLITYGSVRLSLYGLLIMCLGIFLASLEMHYDFAHLAAPSKCEYAGRCLPHSWEGWAIMLTMFVILCGLLCAIFQSPNNITFDRREGFAEQRRSIVFIPLPRKKFSLSLFQQVALRLDRNRYDVYTSHVQLRLEGQKKLVFASYLYLEDGERFGKEVSSFLNLPLEDKTNGKGRHKPTGAQHHA